MRNTILALISIALTVTITILPTPAGCIEPAQGVIAMVNDNPITLTDMMLEEAHLRHEMQLRNSPVSIQELPELKSQLLDNLIDRELLYQQAQEKNLKIRPRWVERALAEFKTRTGSDAAYASFLEQSQMSEEQLRDRLRKGLIVQRFLRREVARGIKVSETEMQTFYRENPDFFVRQEQIRVRHILIKIDREAELNQHGEALLKIQSIQAELHAGANFGALALAYSEDESKHRGGDIGIVERHQLMPDFAQAAFALQPGEISDIVETRLGYHLIQLVQRIPSSTMAYRNARTKIERTLRRNKEKKAAEKYLARLKSKSTITRLDP